MTSQSEAQKQKDTYLVVLETLLIKDTRDVQNKAISFSQVYKPLYLQTLRASNNHRYRRMVTIAELNPTESKAFKKAFDEERRKFSLCVEAVQKATHSKKLSATKYIEELGSRLQEITHGASYSKSEKTNP